MTFRFFKSVLFSLLLGATLGAQAPSTPAPKKKPKEGYLRFWNFLPKDQGSLLLMKTDAAAVDGEVLISAPPFNYYADYTAFPPSRYQLKVVRKAMPAEAIANFDVILRDNVCVTFAASSAGGKLKVEMIDDTYSLEQAPAGRLKVWQEMPGVRVSVTANTRQGLPSLAPGEIKALDGLPLTSVAFEMKAVHADGKAEFWSADFDFSYARRASLLIVPDSYGRFRPRVAVDGKIVPEEPVSTTPPP